MRPRNLALAGTVLLLFAAACTHTTAGPGAASQQGAQAFTPSPLPLPPHAVARIAVGAAPDGLDAAFGSIWVTEHHNEAVQRIDPRTNAVVATISLGQYPTEAIHGFGYEWVLDYGDRRLWRIDPNTNEATPFRIPNYGDGVPAAGLGSIWVSVDNGGATTPSHIEQLDPRTLRTVKTLPSCGVNCYLAVSGGRLWVGAGTNNTFRNYDPATGAWRTVTTQGRAIAPAIGPKVAYVTRDRNMMDFSNSSIVRIDTATGRTTGVVKMQGGATAVIDGTHIWIVDRGANDVVDGHIYLLDPQTMKATPYTNLDITTDSPHGVIVADGSLWVSDFDGSNVYRIAEPS